MVGHCPSPSEVDGWMDVDAAAGLLAILGKFSVFLGKLISAILSSRNHPILELQRSLFFFFSFCRRCIMCVRGGLCGRTTQHPPAGRIA